ncbi:MAG: hypothetical protein ACT4TC_14250 [Myxococcaceae bacterium]
MNLRILVVGVVLLSCAGCARSNIRPDGSPKPKPIYIGDKTCMVQDFPSATDVPEGSQNLGWVSVPYKNDDETTYIELRTKICELGGDAMTQPAWVKGFDENPELKANAWSLP